MNHPAAAILQHQQIPKPSPVNLGYSYILDKMYARTTGITFLYNTLLTHSLVDLIL